MDTAISARQKAALERLIKIAQADTGQGRMAAEFLLSWWNASNCGGFDLTTLWGVDTEIAADMITVFALVAGCHRYPGRSWLRRGVPTNRPRLAPGIAAQF